MYHYVIRPLLLISVNNNKPLFLLTLKIKKPHKRYLLGTLVSHTWTGLSLTKQGFDSAYLTPAATFIPKDRCKIKVFLLLHAFTND